MDPNEKVTLIEADNIFNKMFLSGAGELNRVLAPKLEKGGIILCTRTCVGVLHPDVWMYNQEGTNLILKWNKGNNTWENLLPAPGIPLVFILSKKEYMTGYYTDACITDENESTVMVYKVLDHMQISDDSESKVEHTNKKGTTDVKDSNGEIN